MRSKLAPKGGFVMVTTGVPPGEVSGGVVKAAAEEDSVESGCAASSRSGRGTPEFVAVTTLNLSALLSERQGEDGSTFGCISPIQLGTQTPVSACCARLTRCLERLAALDAMFVGEPPSSSDPTKRLCWRIGSVLDPFRWLLLQIGGANIGCPNGARSDKSRNPMTSKLRR